MGTAVWDDDVAKLLDQIKPKEVETSKQALENYLGEILSVLKDRQDVWGALLNYPRTVVLAPDKTFKYTWKTAVRHHQPLSWETQMKAGGELKLNPRDVDQVLWVNHCSIIPTTTTGSKSGPVVEIGLLHMNHERRSAEQFSATFGAVRLVTHGHTAEGGEDFVNPIGGEYKTAEVNEVVGHVFGATNAKNIKILREVGAFLPPKAPPGKDDFDYLKRCAVVLEFAMRNRTAPIENALDFAALGHVGTDRMHKAVSTRQIPYAASDLTNPQPAVMPGETDLDKIVGVLKDVVGFGTQVKGAFTGTPYDTIFDEEAAANPYDALDDMSQDGDDVVAGGALTPFSGSEDELEI